MTESDCAVMYNLINTEREREREGGGGGEGERDRKSVQG